MGQSPLRTRDIAPAIPTCRPSDFANAFALDWLENAATYIENPVLLAIGAGREIGVIRSEMADLSTKSGDGRRAGCTEPVPSVGTILPDVTAA